MVSSRALSWVFGLGIGISIVNALPQVPVATEPILATITVETAIPSTVTIYSVTTISAETAAELLTTITSTLPNGQITELTETVAASTDANAEPALVQTNTLYSTTLVTTTTIIVSTIGSTVITGAAPVPTDNAPATEGDATTSIAATSDIPTYTAGDVTTSSFDNPSSITSYPSQSAAAVDSGTDSTSSGGLSTGAKAGIGVGVVLGVSLVAVACFFLGQKVHARRQAAAAGFMATQSAPDTDVSEKDVDVFTFRAGKPYELTGSKRQPCEIHGDRHHPSELPVSMKGMSAATTEVGGSESGRSLKASSSYNDPSELSALPRYPERDDQMYIGVPSHMSGSKRWSMKEYEKE